MITLGVIACAALALFAVSRTLPIFSQSYRVKLFSVPGGYYKEPTVQLVVVKRFKTGGYSVDRLVVGSVPLVADDFDDLMAQALSDAEHRVRLMRAAQRASARIR